MVCDAEDWGFQMLNDDESVTSAQEESDLVDNEMDEDEDKNNESRNSSSNADVFSALETAMECRFFVFLKTKFERYRITKKNKMRKKSISPSMAAKEEKNHRNSTTSLNH
ncbi:hypothetical protein TNCV_1242751 [Trichonephila clavipes]|nr:hypothetical protein TNCV_1242751 [Trichonephila clavipes]